MTVKLFIMGLPGSGKSTISRHLSSFARGRQWLTTHIYDYDILYQMFQEDTQGQFRSAAYGGFDVLDLSVLDTALRKLEQKVRTHISTAQLEEIVLIEFSRNNYEKAFQQFSQEFLQDAYFLYLSVDLETCKSRICERIAELNTRNDHFISEYIFSTYYNGDDGNRLPQILESNYGIDQLRVRIVNNGGTQRDISPFVDQFVGLVIAFEAHRLGETEPMQLIKYQELDSELERNR